MGTIVDLSAARSARAARAAGRALVESSAAPIAAPTVEPTVEHTACVRCGALLLGAEKRGRGICNACLSARPPRTRAHGTRTSRTSSGVERITSAQRDLLRKMYTRHAEIVTSRLCAPRLRVRTSADSAIEIERVSERTLTTLMQKRLVEQVASESIFAHTRHFALTPKGAEHARAL